VCEKAFTVIQEIMTKFENRLKMYRSSIICFIIVCFLDSLLPRLLLVLEGQFTVYCIVLLFFISIVVVSGFKIMKFHTSNLAR
jgi:hypothetical protein